MTATRSRWASVKLKARGARVIGVNPIRSGYNAVADDWVGITPGTDGLFILSLIHELMRAAGSTSIIWRATPTRRCSSTAIRPRRSTGYTDAIPTENRR